MASNIFQPLDLNDTSYLQPAGAASPYIQGPSPGAIPDPSFYFSAAALWSNVQNLATGDAALLNGKGDPACVVHRDGDAFQHTPLSTRRTFSVRDGMGPRNRAGPSVCLA